MTGFSMRSSMQHRSKPHSVTPDENFWFLIITSFHADLVIWSTPCKATIV